MGKKILLADDSVTIQKVISITLAHEDFDLTIVDNGTEAISKSREIRPDLILLDVVMPDKDGYQVCAEIRKQSETKNIPIVLLTGTFEPFDEERAKEVGANDFIKKPFESHTLINKVKEMVFLGGVDRAVSSGMGDELGFETPIEESVGEVESMGAEATFSDIDMETPKEAKSPRKKGDEDIWTVEEFEDIAGYEKTPAEGGAGLKSDPWKDVEIPSEGGIEDEPSFGGAGKDIPLSDDSEMDTDGFELGKEISEDELKRFLEDEGLDKDERPARYGTEEKEFAGEDFHEVELDDFDESGGDKEDFFVDDYEVSLDEGNDLSSEASTRGGEPFAAETSEGSYDIEWEEETDSDFSVSDEFGESPDVDTEFVSRGSNVDFGEIADFEEYGEKKDTFEEPSVAGRKMTGLVDDVVTDKKKRITEMVTEKVHEVGLMSDRNASKMSEKEFSKVVDKIAREVIEKVAWEVVPELAEELIKEEIRRLKGELS